LGDDITVVVSKPVLTGLVYFDAIVAPDDEFAVVAPLPVERSEAVVLTELADGLWVCYTRIAASGGSL
jgi:hypothetical protein